MAEEMTFLDGGEAKAHNMDIALINKSGGSLREETGCSSM